MVDIRVNPRRIRRISKVADIRCADRIWPQIRDPYPPISAADIHGYPRANLFRFKYACSHGYFTSCILLLLTGLLFVVKLTGLLFVVKRIFCYAVNSVKRKA